MVSPYSWGFSIWTVWVFSISLLPVFSNALHLYFTHRLPAWVVWKLKQMVAIPRAISNLSFRVIIAQWWGFSGLYCRSYQCLNIYSAGNTRTQTKTNPKPQTNPKIVVNLKCNNQSKITPLPALSYLGQCSKTSSILFWGVIQRSCLHPPVDPIQKPGLSYIGAYISLDIISFDLPWIVSYHYTITLLLLAYLTLVLALLASFSYDWSS